MTRIFPTPISSRENCRTAASFPSTFFFFHLQTKKERKEDVGSLQESSFAWCYFWSVSISTIGLTVGIGWSLAEKYAETGTQVIAVGRRQNKLDELASKYPGKISTKQFDISKLDQIPQFVEEVTKEYPDIDCVFLNRLKY